MKTKIQTTSKLELKNFLLNIHLGITEQEQFNKQPVNIDISINNKTPPLGCVNDNINNTLCYDKICSLISEKSSNKTYNLIEHLCQDILDLLTEHIKNYCLNNKIEFNTEISVKIKKSPPIDNLQQAEFSLNATFT